MIYRIKCDFGIFFNRKCYNLWLINIMYNDRTHQQTHVSEVDILLFHWSIRELMSDQNDKLRFYILL